MSTWQGVVLLRARRRIWLFLIAAAILAGGIALRARDIVSACPNGDEGESAINALTILQTGVPRGNYLGLPIYENCLIEPWPENPEYEFRDSSYSPSGLAIYHGWLPLYSMAASMKAMGVTPDEPSTTLEVRHSDDEIRTRVLAARLPSLVFSTIFLLFLFLAARDMFGADAAFAALLVGTIGRPLVYMGHEARYYSATLALSTACCWAIWRVFKCGSWREYIIAAVLISLLFYAHMLAWAVACAMFALMTPALVRRDRRAVTKSLATGAIVVAAAAPWILLTGFLHQHVHLPPARDFLSFPADLIYYPILHEPFLIFPLLGLLWLIVVLLFHNRLPRAAIKPLAQHHRQILFLMVWIAVGILAFTMLIPAASYFYKRLTLAVVGPGIIWGAILVAAAARSLSKRYALLMAPIAFAAIVALSGMAFIPMLEGEPPPSAYGAIPRLREMRLDPRTKIYCTPNDQLALVYLTGLPVQSVAPVRKSFIDSYAGPILLIDGSLPHLPLRPRDIVRVAKSNGVEMSPQEAKKLATPLTVRLQRQMLQGTVASIDPDDSDDPQIPPRLSAALERAQEEKTAKDIEKFARFGCNSPLLRGFTLRDWGDWWPVFFYRFVDPRSRMGANLNYASRIRTARSQVLPNAWVLYDCPSLSPPSRR